MGEGRGAEGRGAAERAAFQVGAAGGEAGARLDRFLAVRMPERSRAEIQRWIGDGRVSLRSRGPGGFGVDRIPASGTVLRAGDEIEVRIPPPRIVELRPEKIGLRVLHNDDTIMVIDKPPGLVSHPSPGHDSGTLVNALLYVGGDNLSRLSGDDRPGLVHRLDRDTSGVMVIARTDPAHRALVHQFKHRETEKEYLAITEGAPRADKGEIEGAIARHPHDRQRFSVQDEGRSAETRYEVLRRFQGDRFAYVRLRPRTGRTHQIRVHLGHLGTPVLCDPLYGRRAIVYAHELEGRGRRRRGERPVLSRHALHASRLTFTHPATGERVTFEAPLPADIEGALDALRSSERT